MWSVGRKKRTSFPLFIVVSSFKRRFANSCIDFASGNRTLVQFSVDLETFITRSFVKIRRTTRRVSRERRKNVKVRESTRKYVNGIWLERVTDPTIPRCSICQRIAHSGLPWLPKRFLRKVNILTSAGASCSLKFRRGRETGKRKRWRSLNDQRTVNPPSASLSLSEFQAVSFAEWENFWSNRSFERDSLKPRRAKIRCSVVLAYLDLVREKNGLARRNLA